MLNLAKVCSVQVPQCWIQLAVFLSRIGRYLWKSPPVIDNVTDLESARIWRQHQLSRITTDFDLCKYNGLSEDWRHCGVSVRIRARF